MRCLVLSKQSRSSIQPTHFTATNSSKQSDSQLVFQCSPATRLVPSGYYGYLTGRCRHMPFKGLEAYSEHELGCRSNGSCASTFPARFRQTFGSKSFRTATLESGSDDGLALSDAVCNNSTKNLSHPLNY